MEPEPFSFTDHSHRRYNPLTRSWVLCSPHRAKRPWQGQLEKTTDQARPQYDPGCYLCPGNTRASGKQNDKYTDTYVFPNDFAAVQYHQPDCTDNDLAQVVKPSSNNSSDELFQVKSTKGKCMVVCFSPRHDLTLPELSPAEIVKVINTWQEIYTDLSGTPGINYIQLFENKGAAMGCSNPHPHGQVWTLSDVPSEPAQEIESFKAFHHSKDGKCLLCTYVQAEQQSSPSSPDANRIVLQNDSFVVLVPFWATWPFETMIVAKSHISRIIDLNNNQIQHLAEIMQGLTCRYDNLFQCSFPYSMGLHQAPVAAHPDAEYCHLHLHFYPPLLRSASVRKFLVGFEMLAEPQRDLTAEQAAARLRNLNHVHYKQ